MLFVALAAQYKNKLYTLWCTWMLEQIESKKFQEKSKNWIDPSKAVAIQWCAAAWDEITLGNLKNGCRKCYMDPADLDEEMAKYDKVKDFSKFSFSIEDKAPQGMEKVIDEEDIEKLIHS